MAYYKPLVIHDGTLEQIQDDLTLPGNLHVDKRITSYDRLAYRVGLIETGEQPGATWSDLGQQFSQTYIRSLAYLGNGIALAGTNPSGKILRSTDYGATWSDLGQQFSQTYVISLAYLGNGIVLAGTNPSGKMLRSAF